MGKKSRNKKKKTGSPECNCPGCAITHLVDEIQDRLLNMAALHSQFHNYDPDPRFIEIRDSVVALGDDILSCIANVQAEHEIGVPFIEGTPEFMAIMTGKKYH
jgi:hypothetical protein